MNDDTLYAEPIVGWRYWRMQNLRLVTGWPQIMWTPLEPLRAVHQLRATFRSPGYTKPCDDAPCDHYDRTMGGYGCGIYAYKSEEDCRHTIQREVAFYSKFDPPIFVAGQVYLWGRIYEHERGYRAQYAYPKKFVWSSELEGTYFDDLARTYNVPVEVTWKLEIPSVESWPNPYMYPIPYGRLTSPALPMYMPPPPSLPPNQNGLLSWYQQVIKDEEEAIHKAPMKAILGSWDDEDKRD